MPQVIQRLETVPPIGINVTATALEQHFSACEVKPEIRRQGCGLLRVSACRNAVRILAQAYAAAMVINRNNPAHCEVLFVKWRHDGARHIDERRRKVVTRPPGGVAAQQGAFWRCDSGRCPIRCRSSCDQSAARPPGSNRCR